MASTQGEKDFLAKPYVPIDTDLVDDIEHYSSDQMHVVIEYKDRDFSTKTMRGFIADVYTTKQSEEFLKMKDGRILRLDQLLKVEPTDELKNGEPKDDSIDLEERLNIDPNRFFPNGAS